MWLGRWLGGWLRRWLSGPSDPVAPQSPSITGPTFVLAAGGSESRVITETTSVTLTSGSLPSATLANGVDSRKSVYGETPDTFAEGATPYATQASGAASGTNVT